MLGRARHRQAHRTGQSLGLVDAPREWQNLKAGMLSQRHFPHEHSFPK
jgi:hypothetical protein